MRRREMHIGLWWKARRKGHYEDIDMGGRIILKWILEK
jgi:hypothetical protein